MAWANLSLTLFPLGYAFSGILFAEILYFETNWRREVSTTDRSVLTAVGRRLPKEEL